MKLNWVQLTELLDYFTKIIKNGSHIKKVMLGNIMHSLLEYEELDDDAIIRLLKDGLMEIGKLQFLSLSSLLSMRLFIGNNNIDEKGANAIATAIANNKTLTELDLCIFFKLLFIGNNNIGPLGAAAFATMLSKNNALTMLNIGI